MCVLLLEFHGRHNPLGTTQPGMCQILYLRTGACPTGAPCGTVRLKDLDRRTPHAPPMTSVVETKPGEECGRDGACRLRSFALRLLMVVTRSFSPDTVPHAERTDVNAGKRDPAGMNGKDPTPERGTGRQKGGGRSRGGQAKRSPAVHAGSLHVNTTGCRNHPVRLMPEPPTAGLDGQAGRSPLAVLHVWCDPAPRRPAARHEISTRPDEWTRDETIPGGRSQPIPGIRSHQRGPSLAGSKGEIPHVTSSANTALAPPSIAPSTDGPSSSLACTRSASRT